MVSVNRDDLRTSPRRPVVAAFPALLRRAALRIAATCALAAFAWSAGQTALAAGAKQLDFASADQAVEALAAAVRANDTAELLKILGPGGRNLVFSGDPISDKEGRAGFAERFDHEHKLQMEGDDKATLSIGNEEWPFPIPLVKAGERWHFDTKTGVAEILARRVGRNELNTIEVCRAYVDAQHEYATTHASGSPYMEYAQKFMSTSGKRDGLYWPVADGETPSPMGPLVAGARAEGYSSEREPYHGYYYKILTRQGPNAQGGAYDYVVHNRMIGGFALVAFPVKYGDSGVMTFLVNHDGIVYQKDLGPKTAEIARRMSAFNPDSTWTEVK
ncbi:MAG TPA: DUF2950 domain-containing protein [Alphaproteobacteria bacterium]|nr:DUF2950 domain-containing protein [Alphaproteobacteria bacterium]